MRKPLLHTISILAKSFIAGSIFFSIIETNAANVDTWVRKADFPGAERINAVSFVINGQAFVGTGQDSQGNLLTDFWKFDPDLNTWSQVADFAGVARKGAVGFAIDTIGYVGTGFDNTNFLKDFWSFNPVSNTWQSEQELGLYNTIAITSGRRDAVAIVARSRAYILCGYDGSSGYVKQTWEFNPSADTCWTIKRNLGNVSDLANFGRRWATGFAIRDTVYFGTGFSFSQDLKKDFWKYNPLLDAWTQLADFEGEYRSNAISFSLFDKGYVGCGTSTSYQNDLWKYDPVFNSWMAVASYPGLPFSNGTCFVINNRAFAGLGNDSLLNIQTDLWEYTPDSTSSLPEYSAESGFTVYPNPAVDRLRINSNYISIKKDVVITIFNSKGQLSNKIPLDGQITEISLNTFSPGVYFYSISDSGKKITCGKFIVQ